MSATCQGCGVPIPPSRGGPPRKWCSGRCRKASYGQSCVDCGRRTTHGAESARVLEPRCVRCAAAHRARQNRELVERLWAEGKTEREIRAVTGSSMSISSYRALGYNLPHRNRVGDLTLRLASLERARAARRVVSA